MLGIGPAVGETERDWPGRRANGVLDKFMARVFKNYFPHFGDVLVEFRVGKRRVRGGPTVYYCTLIIPL